MAVTEKDFTLSWGDITIGAPNTIAVTRPSSQYSFRFRCEFQGVTVNLTAPELMIVSQDDTRVVFQWTPDESLSLAIPDSVSGTGTLTMTVAYTSRFEQLSNPEFCVKTYDFTAYVPDSMRPSATLTVALVNDNALLEQWGLWVRGMSCLQYAVEASAVGGATLKSCRFTFAGQTVSGFSGVTAPIGMAGTLTPAAVVTDSRGRTTTVSAAPVAVFDYQTPSLRTSVAYRCNAAGVEDSGGACLQVKAVGSCWPLDGRNTVTLRARYRPVGGVYGGYTTLVSGLTAQIADSLDKDTTYEVELSAVDTVGSVRAVSYTSSNASVAFHLRSGGVGAAFGKLAEQQLPPHIHHVEGFTSVDSTTHDHGVPNVIQGGSGGEAYAESWSGGTGRRELTTSAICINHDHTVDLDSQPCGGGEAVGILPPYLAVYMWQRVS